MSRRLHRVLGGAAATAALVGGGLAIGVAPVAASPLTLTFDRDTVNTWTVPPGVTTVHVRAAGAQGGGGDSTNGYAATGGLGAVSEFDVAVTAGQTFYFHIGNKGEINDGPSVGGGGSSSPCYVGSGGGATEVRRGTDTVGDRIVIVGGGGGAGGTYFSPGTDYTSGGNGGNGSVAATAAPALSVVTGGGAGAGSAGGAGGVSPSGVSGAAGTSGAGGAGGCDSGLTGGGGGGGGYFGGGGGAGSMTEAQATGGGGGSGWTSPSLTNVVEGAATQTGDGLVEIQYDNAPSTTPPTTPTTTPNTVPSTPGTPSPTAPRPGTPRPSTGSTSPTCPTVVRPNRVWGNVFSLSVAGYLKEHCDATLRSAAMGGQTFWVVDPPTTSVCPTWRAVRVVASRESLLIALHLLDTCGFDVRAQAERGATSVYVVPDGYPAGRATA